MSKFLKQFFSFLLVGLVPLLLLTIGYFVYDPFSVVKSRSNYYNLPVVSNRDYISTEMFVKNYPIYHYNAFIFGSSRTIGYDPISWKKYLPADAVPFMFDASGESVYGIYMKFQFLQRNRIPIKYSLIILDRDVSFENSKNQQDHLFIKHPLISLESKFDFYTEFYKAYLNPKFLFNYYYFKFSGKYKPFMKGYIEYRNVLYDSVTNKSIFAAEDKALLENSSKFYADRKIVFEKAGAERTDGVRRIKEKEKKFLQGIKSILDLNKANYKVVISPLYEQIKLHPQDDSTLKSIFTTNYFNFSGKNSFTDKQTNYYEANHYTPRAGESILKIIYSADTDSIHRNALLF